MTDDWYPGQFDRSWEARGDDEQRRMDEEDAAYERNHSLRPSVLLSRLWQLVSYYYGKLQGWW